MNYLETAIEYHDAGLVVIPWWYDEEKKVRFYPWTEYQFGQSKDQVNELFTKRPEYSGIALVCTNGMEVIDIDVKADPKKTIAREYFDDLFWRTGGDQLRQKCVIVRTKSNGWHVIYRAKNAEGNTKLASRKGMSEAMIETRGPGGLIFAAPSPGYEVKQGDYKSIQIISDAERNILIETALSLDENPIPVQPVKLVKTAKKGEPKEGLSPGDDYSQRTDLLGLLEDAGWRVSGNAPSGVLHLSKPGASNPRDTHATLIESSDGTPIFYPFTTGTEFEPRRCYNAFAVYTQLMHRGDYKAAAKQIRAQGYGEMPEEKKEQKVDVSALISFVKSTKFDNTAMIREESAILTLEIEGQVYKVGGRGQMGVITGEQKSGKSLVMSCIAASGLSGGDRILNFSLNLDKGMEYYDTEQSSYFYQLTQKRLHELAGIKGNADKYAAYLLRRLSIKDRLAAIDEMLKGRKDLSCIIIDGAVDLCADFNDVNASTQVADKLLQWSDQTGAMLITVLHTTKAAGYLRGHLGTALQNKADFVIQTKQDKGVGVYTVECRESRFAPFPSFEFTRDQKGFPVLDTKGYSIDQEPEPSPGILILQPSRMNDDVEIPF